MKCLFLFFILLANHASAQTLVNLVMIDGSNKVTDKAEKANYIILVKKYNDSSFERIEYKFAGPRLRSIFYKDPELKIKQGESSSYNDSGYISISGPYVNNMKSGRWYDATKKEFREYRDDVLISTEPNLPPDTTKKNEHWEEIESVYPGGQKAYFKFLEKNLNYPDRATKMRIEGNVVFQFVVDEKGNPRDVSIVKSMEFSLDEEVLRLASIMPKWIPARQDGKVVKSYKKQPLTFKLP